MPMTSWFDPFSAASLDDPYPLYRRLRDESPVYHYGVDGKEIWVLSRFDDVRAAFDDRDTFSSRSTIRQDFGAHLLEAEPQLEGGQTMLRTDPPDHENLRRAVKTAFSPKMVKRLAGKIQATAESLVEQMPSSGSVDLAKSFTWALTLPIISDMLDIPEQDRSLVYSWYQDKYYPESFQDKYHPGSYQDKFPPGAVDVVRPAGAKLTDYMSDMASDRLSHPREDLMSELMKLCANGTLSRASAILLWRDLFEGGIDAPAGLMGNALLGLAKHPDQHAVIVAQRDDTAAMKLAVEEFARYDAPVQTSSRITAREVEVRGEQIPAGSSIMLLHGSANHDDRRYPNPDKLDVTRPAARHLAYGSGIHFCIGAPLARLETQIALPVLLSALEEYEVVAPIERPPDFAMRSILSLPTVVRKGAA